MLKLTVKTMRTFCCSALLLFVAAAIASASQQGAAGSVLLQKKTVVLVRQGHVAREFPERRRATVSYPVVVGGIESPAVLSKVRSLLEVKNIFDTSLAEYRADAWLTEFDYRVNYNKNFILDITFTQSGVAAYPDTQTKHLAINLKTGELIKAADVFKADALNRLAELVNQKLQAEIKQKIRELQQDKDTDADEKKSLTEAFEGLKIQVENLDDFSISDKGMTFLYDAGFPHVIQALQPERKYFFSYAELRPFIKTDGLLGKFIQ